MTPEEKSQKIDLILKKFVYGDVIDIEESKRIKELGKQWDKSYLKAQIAKTEPVQMFITEMRNDVEEINSVLMEKYELDEIERKALILLKRRIEQWIDFWEGSDKRLLQISNEIGEEFRIKTA